MRTLLRGDELRGLMPNLETVPFRLRNHHWTYSSWWDLHLRDSQSKFRARMFLNGGGADHELRFVAWGIRESTWLCPDCHGERWVERERRPRPDYESFLPALRGSKESWDPPNEQGLYRCLRCKGDGRLSAKLGACDNFISAPGLSGRLGVGASYLGARGLSNPTAIEAIIVLKWLDDMVYWMYRNDGHPELSKNWGATPGGESR